MPSRPRPIGPFLPDKGYGRVEKWLGKPIQTWMRKAYRTEIVPRQPSENEKQDIIVAVEEAHCLLLKGVLIKIPHLILLEERLQPSPSMEKFSSSQREGL